MTRYVGLDLHKHVVQASLINEEGKRLESYRFACTQESLLAFARERLRPEDQIALEATTNTWAVVALLRPFVARIVVANALRTRAIAEAKVKTDKVDAESLATCQRSGNRIKRPSNSGNSVFGAPAWLQIRRGSKTVSAACLH